jgi:serine/threonine protein phosphatase PrpC
LCTDGLSNKVSAAEIQQIILENFDQLHNACASLIRMANENGGEDNITLVIARFAGDSLTEPEEEGVKLELIDLGGIHDTADQDTLETL